MHHQLRIAIVVAIAAITLAIPAAAIAETSVFASHAQPASASLDATLDALQHHYETTRSFSAKFTEQIASVGAPVRTREGTVAFSKPGKMRWDFESPNKELLVSNGQTLFSYDPGLNQVVETPLKDALRAPGATEFLLGAGNIRKDFVASAPKVSALRRPDPRDADTPARRQHDRARNRSQKRRYPAASDHRSARQQDLTRIHRPAR